jgi:Flp pilus assembly protein protease CpaA
VEIWLALAAAAWLGVMVWQDLGKREVSNWLTIPPVFLAGGWWAWRGEWSVLVLLLALVAVTELFDRLHLPPVLSISVAPALASGIGHFASPRVTLVLMTWSVVWVAWVVRFVGAADAKVLMALVGFWPDTWLVGLLIAAQLLWSVYHLVQRYRSRALKVAVANAAVVPADEDLAERGVPTIPAYAGAGLCYLVLATVGVF